MYSFIQVAFVQHLLCQALCQTLRINGKQDRRGPRPKCRFHFIWENEFLKNKENKIMITYTECCEEKWQKGNSESPVCELKDEKKIS